MSHPCHTAGNLTIVTLSGKVDTTTAPETTRQLKETVLEGGANLALDASGVTFMDSVGLTILVSVLKLAREQGGDLIVLRPSPVVRALLDVTRLDQILRICEDEESAAAAFEG